MKRLPTFLSMAILAWSTNAAPVFAGGQVFVGIGGGRHFFPGTAFAFHNLGSRVPFFLQFRHQPFAIFPWAPASSGYYYPPAMSIPYPVAPQEVSQQGFSGTDLQGALYVDGYRVLPSGWLRIRVEPPGAEVLIDGFPIAIDSDFRTSASLGFPVGKHQVEARKPGFQEFQSEVEITQARESRLEIRLSQ
jgi:PEGA domain